MIEPLMRQIRLLSLIPARPRKVTVAELAASLEAEGMHVHRRSIERYLRGLQDYFPIRCDDGRPAGWSWATKVKPLQLPTLDPEAAMTLALMERYLAALLPRTLMDQLQPQFELAKQTLRRFPQSRESQWLARVAAIPQGYPLIPPPIAASVTRTAYAALLEGRCFEAEYRGMLQDAPRRFLVHPLGLVYRGGVLYLVAMLDDYDDVRQLALHRMTSTRLTDLRARAKPDFSLERYIRADRAFEFPVGRAIRLELRVEPWLAQHLSESRLSDDQAIRPVRGSDESTVTATVSDTDQLRWWLRSLGADVEVLKPASLRGAMRSDLRDALRLYGTSGARKVET